MEKLFETIIMNDEKYEQNNYGNIQKHWLNDDASGDTLKRTFGSHNTTSFPLKNPYTKDGRLKRVPAACLYIARNPGCTKAEIQKAIEHEGWTSYNVELYAHIKQQNLVRYNKEGKTSHFYPTFRCIDYLKMLGLIDKDEKVPYTVGGIFEDNSENANRREIVSAKNRKNSNIEEINFDDD